MSDSKSKAIGIICAEHRAVGTEENELIPLAKAHLLASDWDAIAHAFARNADPLMGLTDKTLFDALFHDIVNRTPAPLGLGAA